jgi:hypothetical protein
MVLLGFIRSRKLDKSGMKSKGDNFRNRINSMLFPDFKGEEMRKTWTFFVFYNIVGKDIILRYIF